MYFCKCKKKIKKKSIFELGIVLCFKIYINCTSILLSILSKVTHTLFKVHLCLSVLAFPGNQTHNLGVVNSMLYCFCMKARLKESVCKLYNRITEKLLIILCQDIICFSVYILKNS